MSVHYKIILFTLVGLFQIHLPFAYGSTNDRTQKFTKNEKKVSEIFETIRRSPRLRHFLRLFPKGADLHSHLSGTVFAEDYLEWAVQDGSCIEFNENIASIVETEDNNACSEKCYKTAAEVLESEDLYQSFINSLGLRNFIPSSDWSAADQFFSFFDRNGSLKGREGKQLAKLKKEYFYHSVLYTEQMSTLSLGPIWNQVKDVQLSGDVNSLDADYEKIAQSIDLEKTLSVIQSRVDKIFEDQKKALDGQCNDSAEINLCSVKIRILDQVIRTLDPQFVFGQFFVAWHLIERDSRIVGVNLVAPEHSIAALKHYDYHMALIGYLQTKIGFRNVSLHAGEIAQGLANPLHVGYHIREAIETAKAKRIGHAVDIEHDKDPFQLMRLMKDRGIAVEINLVSNFHILGIEKEDHPVRWYFQEGVPVTLSSDDIGVSRSNITMDYMRAARDHDFSYKDLKQISYNGIKYSFLSNQEKRDLTNVLDQSFLRFEKEILHIYIDSK